MISWIESHVGVGWLEPQRLWALILLPLALGMRWLARPAALRVAFVPWLRKHARRGPEGPAVWPAMPRSWRTRFRYAPTVLEVLGLCAFGAALARPFVQAPLPRRSVGIDIVLGIDISSSMAAADLTDSASRMSGAKEAAERFVAARPADRIGVLTFARYPELRCPPTTDHAAVIVLLRQLDLVEREGSEDATGIGGAVAHAGAVLASATSPTKVLVLLTDGDENVATTQTPREIAPLHAAQLCRELRVRVHVIVASPSTAATPGRDALRRMAELTEGSFHVASDAASLQAVYEAIDRLERVPFEEVRYEVVERFPWFLGFGLTCFGLAVLVGLGIGEVRP